ncbi:MAG: ATP-binding protein [Myxococcota bacterium]
MAEVRPLPARHEERVLRGTVEEIRPTIAWVLDRLPAHDDATMLDLGLTEALTNAVAHGVNGLDGDERDDDYRAWMARLAEAPGRDGGLRVTVTVEAGILEVYLRWAGTPYTQTGPSPLAPEAVRGRGATLIASVFDEVEVDGDGFGLRLRSALPSC